LQAWAKTAVAFDMLVEPDAGASLGQDRCERGLADSFGIDNAGCGIWEKICPVESRKIAKK
jgi:hypothetical protein